MLPSLLDPVILENDNFKEMKYSGSAIGKPFVLGEWNFVGSDIVRGVRSTLKSSIERTCIFGGKINLGEKYIWGDVILRGAKGT